MLTCTSPHAKEPSDEVINELLQLSKMSERYKKSLPDTATALAVMLSPIEIDAPPKMIQINQIHRENLMNAFMDELSWDKARPTYIKAYKESLSESDAKILIEFYNSPATSLLMKIDTQVTERIRNLMQQNMRETIEKVQQRAEKETKEDYKSHINK